MSQWQQLIPARALKMKNGAAGAINLAVYVRDRGVSAMS